MASTATLLKKVSKRGPINFEKAKRLTPTDFRVGGSYTKKDLDEFINNYSTNEKTFHDVSHFQATGKNADGRYYIKPQRRVSKSSVTTDNRVFSNPMDVSTRVGHVGPTSSLGGNAGNEASASSARVPVSSPKPISPVSGGIKQFPQKKVDIYAGKNRNVGGEYKIEPYNREEALSRRSTPAPQKSAPPEPSVQVTSKPHEPGTSSPEPSTAGSSTNGLIYGKGIGKDPVPDGATVSEAMARNAPEPQKITGGTAQGKKVSEMMKASAPPKSGESVSQNTGKPDESKFGGGAGISEENLKKFTEDFGKKISAEKAADKRAQYERLRDEGRNIHAQLDDLEKQNLSKEDYMKKRGEIFKEHGLDPNKDVFEQLKTQATEDPTTWDWINGNKVIQKAGGTLLLGGAVASCFSNKGRMSNSELYGQNF